LPRHRFVYSAAIVCAAALATATAGCSNKAQVLSDNNDAGWFSKPLDFFGKPDWAQPSGAGRGINLGPRGPVGPEDMVGADGRCAPPGAATAQAAEPPPAPAAPTPPADRAVGSIAGDLAGPAMPAASPAAVTSDPGLQSLEPAAPQVMGGIALGMTECQTVQRAGQPSNVAISAGDKGERKVVLTFLSGPWPGIYTFNSGRLKVIDRAPEQPKPSRTPTKKKKPAKPRTASHDFERDYVR